MNEISFKIKKLEDYLRINVFIEDTKYKKFKI